MFFRFPSELNSETYPQAWQYAAGKFRQSQKCSVIHQIVDRTGHYLFLATMLIFVCGLLYTHLPFPGLQEFFQKAPWFTDNWAKLYSAFLQPVARIFPFSQLFNDLAACLLIAWGIPLAVSAVLALLVQLLYRPQLPAMPSVMTEQEAALTLLNTTRAAKRNRNLVKANCTNSTSMLFLLIMGLILTLFAVTLIQDKPQAMGAMLTKEKYTIYAGAFLGLFSYSVFNYPLALLLRLLYLCPIPNAHIHAMEDYLNQFSPAGKKTGSQDGAPQDFPATDPASLPSGFFSKDVWFSRLSGFPCPITVETFPKAWHWADKKRQWASKKALAAQITEWIAQPMYALVLLVLTFGALYQYNDPAVNAFLNKAPKLIGLWKNIQLFLYSPDAPPLQQGLAWAQFLYLVPLVLSALAALVIFLTYHPISRQRDTSASPMEQSRQLYLLLREGKVKSQSVKTRITGTCNTIYALIWAFLAFALVIFSIQDPTSYGLIEENGTRVGWIVFAIFLGTALGYRIIALPLTFALKLLTHTWIPKKALDLAEEWFTRCEESTPAESVQEQEMPSETTAAEE